MSECESCKIALSAVALIDDMRLVDFYHSLPAQELARQLIYKSYKFPDKDGFWVQVPEPPEENV